MDRPLVKFKFGTRLKWMESEPKPRHDDRVAGFNPWADRASPKGIGPELPQSPPARSPARGPFVSHVCL